MYLVEELYCKLNYHDQKIQRRPSHDIPKHWKPVSTFLGLIKAYRDLRHGRSNHRPPIAERKLYNWAQSPYRTRVTPN